MNDDRETEGLEDPTAADTEEQAAETATGAEDESMTDEETESGIHQGCPRNACPCRSADFRIIVFLPIQ